jgi:glyoxylase-like metal-dependent hydrolase (beta-lactamase superfamily II)
MIDFKKISFNPFQENTWLIWNYQRECVIIDPGCSNAEECRNLVKIMESENLKPIEIWLTHCHIDHVLGLDFCVSKWSIPYRLHPEERNQLRSVPAYAPVYGFHSFRAPDSDGIDLVSGDLFLGTEKFEVLFLPGHSPGHLAFYHKESEQIWAGDVLFRESIGRTDLPGGNHSELLESIRNTLYLLSEKTTVFTGHGSETTIGHEKRFNPFVKA